MLLAGCAPTAGPGTHAGDAYMVKSQRTPFYSFGPAQSLGPDFALSHGARVTMLSYQYGYSHVAVEGSGQSGYVATEDITPAPALTGPAPSPSALLAISRPRHRHNYESQAPTAGDQSQIPLPDFPESKPPPGAPAFRY
jgi:hypothetical protein